MNLNRRTIVITAALAAIASGAALRWQTSRVSLMPARAVLTTEVRALARLRPPARPATGPMLGKFQLTYYWLAHEREAPRGEIIELKTKQCTTLARVTSQFARNVRMEGSGILRDGRLVTMAGNCSCEGPCYRLGKPTHTFGTGASARALSPFRSVAVDPRLVKLGSMLYIPELDGVTMPGPAPWGGFVHDGCVMADDRGGGIKGKQLDLFTARKTHYTSLIRKLGLRRVTVLAAADRCTEAPRRVLSARRGGV